MNIKDRFTQIMRNGTVQQSLQIMLLVLMFTFAISIIAIGANSVREANLNAEVSALQYNLIIKKINRECDSIKPEFIEMINDDKLSLGEYRDLQRMCEEAKKQRIIERYKERVL